MNIVDVVPKDNYLLYVTTDDGKAGYFDVSPYLESEAFAPLKNRNEFERIRNGGYYVEWSCGADLSADTIQARWKPTDNENAQTRKVQRAASHGQELRR